MPSALDPLQTRNLRDLPMLTSVPAGAVFAVQGSDGAVGKLPLADLIMYGVPGDPGLPGTNGVDGVDGVDAVVGLLTNEAHTLPADAAGAILSYAGAAGSFRVFKGQTDVSALFALSTLANPQALTVAYAGQDYSVTAGYDAGELTATLTIRATGSGAMAGVVIDKIFSLAKSRSGSNGNNGNNGTNGTNGLDGLSATLNPSSLPIACFANGVVKPNAFANLSARFEIFRGGSLESAGWAYSIVTAASVAATGTVSGAGVVTPTSVSADDALLVVRAINGATQIDRVLRLPKVRDGGSGVSKSVDFNTLPTSSSFVQVASVDLEIPPQISMTISGGAGYIVNGAGSYTPNMKLMLQDITAGSAAFDVSGTNVFGTTSNNTGGPEPEFNDGSVSASAVVANSSTSPKIMRLLVMARRSGGGQSVAVTFGRATISAGG